jgi:flagellar hook assembly protein FlgD
MPEAERVALTIHDVSGKRIATLMDDRLAAGPHAIDWNGATDAGVPVESGVYIYRLSAGKSCFSRKMIVLR